MIVEGTTGGNLKEESMKWISDVLQAIAKSHSVKITDSRWKAYDTAGSGPTFQLTVVGTRDRRIVKLFTEAELENCCRDQELRSEIRNRLSHLVIFLGGRSELGTTKFRKS